MARLFPPCRGQHRIQWFDVSCGRWEGGPALALSRQPHPLRFKMQIFRMSFAGAALLLSAAVACAPSANVDNAIGPAGQDAADESNPINDAAPDISGDERADVTAAADRAGPADATDTSDAGLGDEPSVLGSPDTSTPGEASLEGSTRLAEAGDVYVAVADAVCDPISRVAESGVDTSIMPQ